MKVKPKALKEGSTIGITAPASPIYDEDKLNRGIEIFKKLKFNVVIGDTTRLRKGYLAGDDDKRADELNQLFGDKDIDGIICMRGGYGSSRILDKLNYKLINDNPKVLIGYSDITALHTEINKRCNMVTFHGPMISSFMKHMDEYTKSKFLKAVTDINPIGIVDNPKGEEPIKVLSKGEAHGEITGGNLSLISSTLGTPYEIDTKDKILFLEDVGEEPYKIDRMLTQLLLSGKLHECSGIVLGQFTNCEPTNPNESLSLFEVISDRFKFLKIPILYNIFAGHGSTKMTIPLGVYAKITDKGEFIIEEGGVV